MTQEQIFQDMRAAQLRDLGPQLKQAVTTADYGKVSRIVDTLRFTFKFNYAKTAEFAHEHTGLDAGEWETILYYADTNEDRN